MNDNKQDDIMYTTVLIFIIILIICTVVYNNFLKEYIQIPKCIFYNDFGIYCPGCGCTRAFVSLSKLDFIESIKHNPTVLYASILVVIYLITQTIARIFKNKKIYTLKYNVIYIYIGIAMLLITCIIKNIIKFTS